MKEIVGYMRPYGPAILLVMGIKLLGTLMELMLPSILEYILDVLVVEGKVEGIIFWGCLMMGAAVLAWLMNITANRLGVRNAHLVSMDLRRDLFARTINLSGRQMDKYGSASLISRMTSDSYNVQSFVQSFQTLCVRAPISIVGGIAVSMAMDPALSSILCVMLPILVAMILFISLKSIPLFGQVQERLDELVRIMRENITGIRVIKALSRMDYERRRFSQANERHKRSDVYASTVLALPGPLMQLSLNVGLCLVVYIGARRVNQGQIKPGVVLAFLTYFNMILQGAMGLNRIFTMLGKASASADRIGEVIRERQEQIVRSPQEVPSPSGEGYLRFEGVYFTYGAQTEEEGAERGQEQPRQTLSDISFCIERGESLGIIGPTGSGKTTLIQLLLRFYDVQKGGIFLEGKNIQTYDKDVLRRRFGYVMQSPVLFQQSLYENLSFGRDLSLEEVGEAVKNAMAEEIILGREQGYEERVGRGGMNFSGGQRQRLMIARALAGRPEILVLDDASSALDYQTDARVREAIGKNYPGLTRIVVAQRVSAVSGLSHILVLEEGRIAGFGTHQELLRDCAMYREMYEYQMGEL